MSVYSKKRQDGSTAWYYCFVCDGKRYRAVGGATRTQALRMQEKVRFQVISGEYEQKKSIANPMIEEFSEIYLRRRKHLKSYKRIDLSARTLIGFFKGRRLGDITAGKIEDYIAKRLDDGVANATINRELTCLKHMYNMAIKWHDARDNPVTDVTFLKEPPGRTRYLLEDDAKHLIDHASAFLKPVIITALNTGMRLGEIMHLTWNQVHIERVLDPYLELTETKNNKARHIPLNDDMIKLLEGVQKRDDDFVFHGSLGQPLKCIKVAWQNALRKSGITDFRFHDLRHTFASHFIMKGGDLLTLKEILGHSSMKMVERYAHLASAHKRRQINVLSGAFTTSHLSATWTGKAVNADFLANLTH